MKTYIVWGIVAGLVWFLLFVGLGFLLWYLTAEIRWVQVAVLSGFAPLIGYSVAVHLDLRRSGF